MTQKINGSRLALRPPPAMLAAMSKHIVMWRLKPEAHGRTAAENAEHIKYILEDLGGKIPGLRHIEVGIDISRTPSSGDVALYTEFESRDAMQVYQDHPLHVEAKEYILAAASERWVVDYE